MQKPAARDGLSRRQGGVIDTPYIDVALRLPRQLHQDSKISDQQNLRIMLLPGGTKRSYIGNDGRVLLLKILGELLASGAPSRDVGVDACGRDIGRRRAELSWIETDGDRRAGPIAWRWRHHGASGRDGDQRTACWRGSCKAWLRSWHKRECCCRNWLRCWRFCIIGTAY